MRVLSNLPQTDLRTVEAAATAFEAAGYYGALTAENKGPVPGARDRRG
jgi:hypothetical protein